jgi:hypothetical protein
MPDLAFCEARLHRSVGILGSRPKRRRRRRALGRR